MKNYNIDFHIELASTFKSVREALIAIIEKLSGTAFEAMASSIELCLAEAMNNIAEHSYAGQRSGTIKCHIYSVGASLFCDLLDKGNPIPKTSLEKATKEFGAPEQLADGGYGLSIIHAIASKVTYSQKNNENLLSLVWKL